MTKDKLKYFFWRWYILIVLANPLGGTLSGLAEVYYPYLWVMCAIPCIVFNVAGGMHYIKEKTFTQFTHVAFFQALTLGIFVACTPVIVEYSLWQSWLMPFTIATSFYYLMLASPSKSLDFIPKEMKDSVLEARAKTTTRE